MSDLTATNCGCNGISTASNNSACNWIWIILLLSCFGGFGGNSRSGGCGSNGLFGGDSCEWIILILCLSCLSGSGLFNGGSGCGCN